MKRKEVRHTQQRAAIHHAFESSGRPLSPQEALVIAQDQVPGLGIATVYRAIKHFLEQRVLQAVELPGSPNRYEVTGLAHHHHFCCRSCDRVYDIEGCPGHLTELIPAGFELENHDIVLHGICSECTDVHA